MNEKMQVEAINRGTVIDHIPAGQGLKIVNRLQLLDNKVRLTVGFNLLSGELGTKDLIKVDDWLFTESEANELALFAPNATVNIIDDYKVVRKINVTLPTELINVFPCPNSNCITRVEPVSSRFRIRQLGHKVQLKCHYCEKAFDKEIFTEN
ncbi:aspartate carbamoyltransferase regulatory subunit [Gynuella sp.]|uniref:aspartate carbamoyltransferase regulatory subunit n=1 Tax=Gynuella sp. TaxID=2969146 RepID=UPI003D1201AE